MNDSLNQQLEKSVRLLALEQEVRQAGDMTELSFLMVNRSQSLLADATIIYWRLSRRQKIAIERVSNIASIDPRNTPLLAWLTEQIGQLQAKDNAQEVHSITTAPPGAQQPTKHVIPEQRTSWQEWFGWPSVAILWCPLTTQQGKHYGGLLFIRQRPWQPTDQAMATRLGEMYAYASQALAVSSTRVAAGLPSLLAGKTTRCLLAIGLLGLLMLSVEQSVIAPASVIAKQPFVVTAPMDGVIETVLVGSNEAVVTGQTLIELDKTRLQNQVDVAEQVLNVARAKYSTTQQLSFAEPGKKALLTPLRLQAEQQEAELKYARQLLRRATIRAGNNGIAVFRDANELLGKPVQLGEKIMSIANPDNVELEIDLAVDDAIIMQPGARVALFLNIDPSTVLHAELIHASYSATPTAEGVLAYRLLAKLDDAQPLPRIGLKGTAKLIGERVRLYQYLFRRPVTILRQTLGW